MMSQRPYYFDAYTTRFNSHIVERIEQEHRLAVVLEKTYFYPTSGGQPADNGHINQLAVTDVSIRSEDQAILHWLEQGELNGKDVQAEVNWARRFDHMQQHSGQHILSQAFIQIAGAETVGFHLSQDSVTIDLDSNSLTPNQIVEAERLANEVVWQNRPVQVIMATWDEAAKLSLRRIPPGNQDKLRLIDIQDFDLTACGGTHIANTGEIGMIKVIKIERRRQHIRIEFCCGRRALHDYQIKNTIINELTASLTTGKDEIIGALNRMRDEVKQSRRTIKKQQSQLLGVEARELLQQGRKCGNFTIVSQVFDERDLGQIRALGSQLTRENSVVALLGVASPKAQLLFSRSADAPGEMNLLLNYAMGILGSNSGGGSATFAQGGSPNASREHIVQAITEAELLLRKQNQV